MNKLFGNQSKIFTEIDKASLDVNNEKIEKLKELFPNIVSDGKVDWNALKLILGDKVTEEEERYRFTWNGKSKAIRESSIPSMNTLRPDKESSKNWDTTENLYIEGDNLEVLKILQNSYNGKIKMIYIDPPYNTGNDFIYKDDFTISGEEAEKQEGLKDKKGITQTIDRSTKNSKDSAKYHTNWLNMMYPRLSIARDLLTDDGIIFISIDTNEVHNLKKITDEIYGENNFIADIIWERAFSPVNLKTHFSESHDFILCYSKNINNLICNGLKRKENDPRYKNLDNDIRGDWTSSDMTVGPAILEKVYEIELPNGKKILPTNGRCWLFTKERYKEMIDNNRIWFGKTGDNVPRVKKFLSEVKEGITPMTIWKHNEVGHSQDAKQKLKKLFGDKAYFDYPKPVGLIKRILELYTNKDSIILDFFSGSGTTAHSIIKLNAEDKGNRKFIMVQLPEKTEEKSEAYKVGYKDICEIGRARIDKAGEKIIADNPEKDLSKLDIGFKTFKIDSSNFNEWDTSYESMIKSVKNSANSNYTTYKEERDSLDLVYEILLKEGHQLTETVEEITVGSDVIYKIADGVMYIFLGKLTDETIEKIVEMKKETYDLFGLNNPSVVLNETYLDTEIKANVKKNFESNGIIDIKTL